MPFEINEIHPTIIGSYPDADIDFALKTNINEQRMNLAQASYVSVTKISSGSSNWAITESAGTTEAVIDLDITIPLKSLVETFSDDWVELDKSGIVESAEETTQTVKDVKKESVLTLIEEIRKTKTIPYSEQIADRLYQLNEDVLEEYPENDLILPDSLSDYYRFLKINTNLSFPSISITSNGNIWVQWEQTVNHHFSIEFEGQGEVVFVAFAPDRYIPSKTNRASGIGTIYSVKDLIESSNVGDWVLIKDKAA